MLIEGVILDNLDQAAKQLMVYAGTNKRWLFYGEMGAGKTALIREVCKAMGVQDEVSSPTFSLVNEYRTVSGETIYHFDLYRIADATELYDIGYEDYLYSGALCLVEWPQLLAPLIENESFVQISISKQDDGTRSILAEMH